MKGRNGTPRSWAQRHDTWKYGNPDPIQLPETGNPIEEKADPRYWDWAMVVGVVLAVVLLVIREVLS